MLVKVEFCILSPLTQRQYFSHRYTLIHTKFVNSLLIFNVCSTTVFCWSCKMFPNLSSIKVAVALRIICITSIMLKWMQHIVEGINSCTWIVLGVSRWCSSAVRKRKTKSTTVAVRLQSVWGLRQKCCDQRRRCRVDHLNPSCHISVSIARRLC